MAEEGFFKRWSRRKIEAEQGHELPPEPVPQPAPEPAPAPAPDAAPAPVFARAGVDGYAPERAPADARAVAPAREAAQAAPPTMADVALLTPESDFSAFVRQGVDADVRRTALKKLFTDPHFNTMDRLDVYIDDYNKPSPVSEAMLASLRHAKSVFQHLDKDDEAEAGADTVAAEDTAVAQPEQTQAEAQPTQDPPALQDDQAQTIVADAYQQHPPETETR